LALDFSFLAIQRFSFLSLVDFSFQLSEFQLLLCPPPRPVPAEKHDTIDPFRSFQTGSQNSEGESSRIQGFGNAQFGWRVLPLNKPFAL